jgi:hypothetical protein
MTSPNRSHVEEMTYRLSFEIFDEHLSDQTHNRPYPYYQQSSNPPYLYYQHIPQ